MKYYITRTYRTIVNNSFKIISRKKRLIYIFCPGEDSMLYFKMVPQISHNTGNKFAK